MRAAMPLLQVGVNGHQLSGGQKQRVVSTFFDTTVNLCWSLQAIARALTRHPKVLLLDEGQQHSREFF